MLDVARQRQDGRRPQRCVWPGCPLAKRKNKHRATMSGRSDPPSPSAMEDRLALCHADYISTTASLERGRLGRRLWCLKRLFRSNQWSPNPRPSGPLAKRLWIRHQVELSAKALVIN